ncbi:hypothetical protein HNO53_13015 [Billgrantia antri]|uniref:Immunity repressor n=1 Tax=Halomonas sulfidivorans TaxID=2733488 RepID=A0ABX7WGM2_9GAMM|nr:hypothetical protein [Halomonas sulfidivorans]QTP59556.1 hypothetical protein HNO53_13015 [Halomonas sulfidivorans]
MKDYEEYTGEDFETLLRVNGFVTASGSVDRQAAADFLGVCKRTIGYMLQGRITKQMYNMLALHTGHQLPGLFAGIPGPMALSDLELEELLLAADADLPEGFDPSNRAHVAALRAVESLTEKDWS